MQAFQVKREVARHFSFHAHPDAYGAMVYRSFVEQYIRKGLVLDVGCGVGDLRMPSVGIDLCRERLETASGGKQSHLILADAEQLPLRAEVFDWVHFAATLMHIPDYRRALAEASRVSKPNGKLFLLEPSSDYIFAKLKISNRNSSVWAQSFGTKEFKQTLKKLGFNLIVCRRCLYKFPFGQKKFSGFLLFLEKLRIPLIGRELLVVAQQMNLQKGRTSKTG